MDLDKGKVVLVVNMTLEDHKAEETSQLLGDIQRCLTKFNPEKGPGQFAAYAQFTSDVQGGETKFTYNKDIATELIKRGLLTPTLTNTSIRFVEKVSTLPLGLFSDLCVNGDRQT